MSIQSTCPLCSNLAIVQAREDTWLVTCPVCLRFTLDPYLMDLFQSAPYRADEGVLRVLPRLSDAAQHTAAEGGRLSLVVDTWQAVASESGVDKGR
jgi:hypothetical protein